MGENDDIVRALCEAFGRDDVPAVLGAFDPQIQWREAENFLYAAGNRCSGPQAVAEGVFQRISDLDNFVVVPEHFVDGGDAVVVEGRYRGTMKVTGTAVDAQFAHVCACATARSSAFSSTQKPSSGRTPLDPDALASRRSSR